MWFLGANCTTRQGGYDDITFISLWQIILFAFVLHFQDFAVQAVALFPLHISSESCRNKQDWHLFRLSMIAMLLWWANLVKAASVVTQSHRMVAFSCLGTTSSYYFSVVPLSFWPGHARVLLSSWASLWMLCFPAGLDAASVPIMGKLNLFWNGAHGRRFQFLE